MGWGRPPTWEFASMTPEHIPSLYQILESLIRLWPSHNGLGPYLNQSGNVEFIIFLTTILPWVRATYIDVIRIF